MAKKTRSVAPDIWNDEHLAEQPARKSTAVGLSERWVRITRLYLKISLWALPVVGILLLVIYSEMGNAPVVEQQKITNQVDSAGKAAAILSVDEWLGAVPAPITGGSVVSWDGFDVKETKPVPENLQRVVTNPSYAVEVHHFTLVDDQGIQYVTDVAVAVDDVNGATVIGTPSLSPVAPSAEGWASDGPWYGLRTESASEPLTVAVNQWAKAFTSGEPDVLRSTVGDPDPTHSYMPLVGVATVVPSFVRGGSVPVIDADGTVSDAPAKTVIAQIELQLTWVNGEPLQAGGGEGNSRITYDVLIKNADTASPVVVAWGGAGSGTQLKAYGQAIVDRKLTTEEGN